MKKGKAFVNGVLSGIVEPIGGILTILAAHYIIPALPYLLSFAAGAMLYVVVEELIPEIVPRDATLMWALLFCCRIQSDDDTGRVSRIKISLTENFKYKNHQRHTDD